MNKIASIGHLTEVDHTIGHVSEYATHMRYRRANGNVQQRRNFHIRGSDGQHLACLEYPSTLHGHQNGDDGLGTKALGVASKYTLVEIDIDDAVRLIVSRVDTPHEYVAFGGYPVISDERCT